MNCDKYAENRYNVDHEALCSKSTLNTAQDQ